MTAFNDLKKKLIAQWERKKILNALELEGWNVTRAAEYLGIERSNFSKLMRKHGLNKPERAIEKKKT